MHEFYGKINRRQIDYTCTSLSHAIVGDIPLRTSTLTSRVWLIQLMFGLTFNTTAQCGTLTQHFFMIATGLRM